MERMGDGSGLRAALERGARLYQADLLPGCYDEWIGPPRERLRRRHRDALGRLVRVLEVQREYEAAIRYAERIVTSDPLDESGYRALMRLHLLNDNRAAAQRTYQSCVATLRRELGLEPSQAMRAAAARMVAEAVPPSAANAVVPSSSPASAGFATPLVGRQRDWEQLCDAWRRADEGRPEFVLVTGEAGIGKSRLAEELLLWAGRQGIVTAKARSYLAEGQLSLAPVADWLRGPATRPHLAHLDPVWLGEVARIMPELRGEFRDLPSYGPISEYGQRQRFFQALAMAVLAAPPPVLLFLDDLQWCDQETIEWLHYLLRFDSAARLLLLGTVRSEELTPQHPLRTLLLSLCATPSTTREIALGPLDAAETASLGEGVGHGPPGRGGGDAPVPRDGGNPLFVVETMRAGMETPGRAGALGAPRRARCRVPSRTENSQALPPRVIHDHCPPARPALLSRIRCHSFAAAIGREFRLDVLCRAGNQSDEDVVQALDEMWQRRLVRELGPNTYDFTHDKLRDVAYAEISAPQRRLLHSHVARALEAIHVEHLDPVAGQIATHYERAGALDQAILYYQRAASMAQRVYANEDAIGMLTRCLSLLDQLPHDEQRDRCELNVLLQLVPIYRVTRGWTAPELERAVYRTLDLCDTVGDRCIARGDAR